MTVDVPKFRIAYYSLNYEINMQHATKSKTTIQCIGYSTLIFASGVFTTTSASDDFNHQYQNITNTPAFIKASNTDNNDRFGTSVALSGNTMVVGAPREDSDATGVNNQQENDSATDSGAVYVFVKSNGTWSQQAYIKPSNTDIDDAFGTAVAISGNTLVIGAPEESSNATGINGSQINNSAFSSGAAYVFTRSGNSWTQQAYLKASNTDSGDRFGSRVTIDNNTVVVGAPGESSSSVGINGAQSNNLLPQSGAAYVFTRTGNNWSQQAYIKASNTDADDLFGTSLAIDSNRLIIGATKEATLLITEIGLSTIANI